MSLELLKKIEEAEAKQEASRAEAQKEARDILKSVEEACVSHERDAALEHRALVQRVLEDAKATANRRIEAMAVEQAKEREGVLFAARARIGAAADEIYKRVVQDGAR